MQLISVFVSALLVFPAALFAAPATQPFWSRALTPPMGWNSWDCFGTTVTEAQSKANADYMATNLAAYGWQYIVVDIQWYEPNGTGYNYPSNPQSNIDAYGRLWPVTNKHPSTVGGLGFKPLADYIHGKGLKFGIHLMRGIPRRAWTQNTPVLGTPYFARDIANTNSTCPWNPDMYGVDTTKPGAQEYYNSVFALIASWEVDFVKVDDLSQPYHQSEIEAIRLAIENCGRPIVLSTSPGATPLTSGAHVYQHANLWRISDDFWDQWQPLYDQFKRLHDWTPYRGPGYWPDGDMLPLGNIRTMQPDNWTRFTTNEQCTLMTMWSIARSPLIMGGHMPNNDAFTLSLLTNREIISVNQASANNRQLFRLNDAIAWTADVPESKSKYVALINADNSGFDNTSALFDSGVISRSTPGRSTNIAVTIAGATKLYLVVTEGGDYFGWDHADWGLARLMRPDGTSNRLGNLTWVSATSGWNPPPKVNTSIEGNPLRINGTTLAYGIGTHASSIIEYNLTPGYTEFRALAGLDDEILASVPAAATNATVRFMVFTNPPLGRTIEVSPATLGINEPVVVRDLWLQQDLGTFTNSFKRQFVEHASGLFKFTPISAFPAAGAPQDVQTSAQTNRVSLNWNVVPGAEAYVIKRAGLSGGPWKILASDVATNKFTDIGLLNGPWFYTVSALQNGSESSPSVEAAAYVEFNWNSQDIGTVQFPGTASLSEGTFAVSGSGDDIWNQADAFHFAFQPLTNDTTLIARVRGQSPTDPWAKAGLMIRETLAAGSKHCTVVLSVSNGCALQYRAATGGSSTTVNTAGLTAPRWLKLTRQGNSFRGYESSDGETWGPLGSPISISMSNAVHVGLAVTAHNAVTISTAFFDQVSIRNAAPPAAPTNLLVSAISETQARLQWTDNATNETGYVVEHRTNLVWEIAADDLAPNATNYLDSALSSQTLWSFRVRAVSAGAYSDYSPVTSLTMPAGIGDGIPGWWRWQYFGNGLSDAGDAAADADPDADGSTNLHEYLAGTNPTNAASTFRIVRSGINTNDFIMQFSSISGRIYEVQRAFRLGTNWTVVADNLAGNGNLLEVPLADGASSTQSFFRVRVKQ